MKNYLTILLVIAWIGNGLNAQYYHDKKRDFQWISGEDYYGNIPGKDGFTLDFATLPPVVGYQSKPINFYLCNANICDKEGSLQFYSNGASIIGPNHLIMDNGAEIEWGTQNEALPDVTGSPMQQGTLILPIFYADGQYLMLYMAADLTGNTDGSNPNHVYMASIDMTLNSGLGRVVSKDELLLSDSLSAGMMTACRHANGRDWWILIPRRAGEAFWRVLYDPIGFHVLGKQAIPSENDPRLGVGNAVFSPDGTRYAYSKIFKTNEYCNTVLYDFDRCSGLLSNPAPLVHPTDSANVPNVAFSPNSRYLYNAFGQYVYQYDTYAADIKASRQLVAVSDGYANLLTARFMQMQLAPDNKIYVSSRSAVHLLHRIDYPDRAGVDCQVCQHCIDSLVASNWALPAYPHFRLGPLDGSPCDSLGLDNIPWARFRFETEPGSAGPLAVQFTDLTAYQPDAWYWDFGDPFSAANSSPEQHPLHTFSAPGLYKVCLRVTNDYGADSICQKVYLSGVSGTGPVVVKDGAASYAAYPNPATDHLTLLMPTGKPLPTQAVLYNILGEAVLRKDIVEHTSLLPIVQLPVGLYRLVVYENQQVVYSQLVIRH